MRLFLSVAAFALLLPYSHADQMQMEQTAIAVSKSSMVDQHNMNLEIRALPRVLSRNAWQKFDEMTFTQKREISVGMASAPKLEDRYLGIKLYVRFLDHFLKSNANSKTGVLNLIQSTTTKKVEISNAELAQYSSIIIRLKVAKDTSASRYAGIICGRNPMPQCQSSVLDAINIMGPTQLRSNAALAMIDYWARVAANPVFIQGSARLAVRVLSKAHAHHHRNIAVNGNLYSDAVASLQEAGSNDPKLHAFVLLGLLSTRGPDIAHVFYEDWDPNAKSGFMRSFNVPLFSSLALTASASNYLDMATWSTGRSYSLPELVKNKLSIDRTYHFWMAGLLHYLLRRHGFPAATSANTVYRTSAAYELKAKVRTKATDRVSSENPRFFYNIETQKNVVLNAAGILWAEQFFLWKTAKKEVDVTALFGKIIDPKQNRKIESVSEIFGTTNPLMTPIVEVGVRVTGQNGKFMKFFNTVHLFGLLDEVNTRAANYGKQN